jgi:hypothetical protein
MKAEESGQHPIVAERPRGFNGIPEPGELREPDVTDAASHMDNRVRSLISDERSFRPNRAGYAAWIAGIAVVGGTIAAIVGSARELACRSRGRASARYPLSGDTKPHGDKLLPHGQHHW